MKRRCSTCVSCCALQFRGKPGGGPVGKLCPHATAGRGCAIHDRERPETCESFTCPWLDGILPSKPSSLGGLVYFDPREMERSIPMPSIDVVLEPGMAFSEEIVAEARLLAKWLKRRFGVDCFLVNVFTPGVGSRTQAYNKLTKGGECDLRPF